MTNKRRRHTAQDVEVIVLDVVEVAHRKGLQPTPGRISLGDQLLRWSNSSVESNRTRTSIPAGVTRRVDFVRVENGLDEQGKLPLIIDVWPQPANQRTHVRSKSLMMELVVTAGNADATRYTVMVHFDGHLTAKTMADAGEVWDHLSIVPPARA